MAVTPRSRCEGQLRVYVGSTADPEEDIKVLYEACQQQSGEGGWLGPWELTSWERLGLTIIKEKK